MRSRLEICVVSASVLFGATVLAFSAAAQQDPKFPDPDPIVKGVIARTAQDEQKHPDAKYTWTVHRVTDELADNGSIKKHEEEEVSMVPIEGAIYERLVKKNGRALTVKEQRDQQRDEAKFRERVKSGKKDPDEVSFNEDLLGRYRFAVVGEETVNGRPAYVLTFEPKSNELPVRRRSDRFLNKIAGRICVDKQDYEVAQVDAHLTGEVTAWAGLLANFKEFNGRWEQARMNDGVWLEKSSSFNFTGRVLFSSMRKREQEQSSDFHELSSASK